MRKLNKKYWPVMVKIDYDYRKEDDIFRWCKENLPDKYQWTVTGSNTFYFKHPEDAMMFKLKWGA